MDLGNKLGLDQLVRGDVLLLRDLGESTHKVIGLGQSIFSHGQHRHANIVHAGLYDGGSAVLEASGEGKGLRAGSFVAKDGEYKFLVFRYTADHGIACAAARWAEILIGERRDGKHGFGHYSKAGAFGSLMHRSSLKKGGTALSDDLQQWAGNYYLEEDNSDDNAKELKKIKERTALYCSGFVVQCYILATPHGAVPPINLDYRYVSPKRLQGELGKGGGWSRAGYIKAGEM